MDRLGVSQSDLDNYFHDVDEQRRQDIAEAETHSLECIGSLQNTIEDLASHLAMTMPVD